MGLLKCRSELGLWKETAVLTKLNIVTFTDRCELHMVILTGAMAGVTSCSKTRKATVLSLALGSWLEKNLSTQVLGPTAVFRSDLAQWKWVSKLQWVVLNLYHLCTSSSKKCLCVSRLGQTSSLHMWCKTFWRETSPQTFSSLVIGSSAASCRCQGLVRPGQHPRHHHSQGKDVF